MHIDEGVSQFNWKIEQLMLDGGFALVSGDPGTGKSVVLRHLWCCDFVSVPKIFRLQIFQNKSNVSSA